MQSNVIFIDLDGTLTPESTWFSINMMLGITPEEDKALFERYLKSDLRYEDWGKELIRLYKEHDPVTKQDFVALAKAIGFRPEAAWFVQAIKEKGYQTILISGSVDVVVETVAQMLGFDGWLACTKAIFEQEIFVDFRSMGDESPTKYTLAKEYCEANGYELSKAIVVDDGGNGKALFEASKGILLGTNDTLKPLAWKRVDSLSEIPALL